MDPKRAAKEAKLARKLTRWRAATASVLAQTRKDCGHTQQTLSVELGWTRAQVANIEAGRRFLELAELQLFADAFSMDPERLYRRILRWDE